MADNHASMCFSFFAKHASAGSASDLKRLQPCINAGFVVPTMNVLDLSHLKWLTTKHQCWVCCSNHVCVRSLASQMADNQASMQGLLCQPWMYWISLISNGWQPCINTEFVVLTMNILHLPHLKCLCICWICLRSQTATTMHQCWVCCSNHVCIRSLASQMADNQASMQGLLCQPWMC